MRRDVFWIPALLVGSALYWTVAMRLGGMSLSVLGSSPEDLELVPAVTIDVDIIDEPVKVDLEVEEGHEIATETEYEAEELTDGPPIIVRLQSIDELPSLAGSISGGGGEVGAQVETVRGVPQVSPGNGAGGVAGGLDGEVDRGRVPPPVEDSIGRTAF